MGFLLSYYSPLILSTQWQVPKRVGKIHSWQCSIQVINHELDVRAIASAKFGFPSNPVRTDQSEDEITLHFVCSCDTEFPAAWRDQKPWTSPQTPGAADCTFLPQQWVCVFEKGVWTLEFQAWLFAQCDSVNILVGATRSPNAVLVPDALLFVFCGCSSREKRTLLSNSFLRFAAFVCSSASGSLR